MKYPSGYIQLKAGSLGVVLYNQDVVHVLGMFLHFKTRSKKWNQWKQETDRYRM